MTLTGIRAKEIWDGCGLRGDTVVFDSLGIVWVGRRENAPQFEDITWVDYPRALVTPGFVDAHVHLTSTGIALASIDLSEAACAADLIDLLAAGSRNLAADETVFGHGWEESRWVDPSLPTRKQIDEAAGNRSVYLSRIDVHAALVSSALMRQADFSLPAEELGAVVRRESHGVLRKAAFASISAAARANYQRAALLAAAKVGVTTVHENGGPVVSSEADLEQAIALGQRLDLPTVVGYWGALGGSETALRLGAVGAAGDLFIDGSLGSHTAHVLEEYADSPSHGAAYVSSSDMAEHINQALDAGLQAGFHVIGDAAMDSVCAALEMCAEKRGATVPPDSVRLEHAEMVSDVHAAILRKHGVALSMQPMFDALWGGPEGMYAQRLGSVRAAGMNRIHEHIDDGLLVGFGSDSPVTPIGPWETLAAAVHHHQHDQRVSPVIALNAHTRAAHALARQKGGLIESGQQADLAVWDLQESPGESAESLVEAGIVSTLQSCPPRLMVAYKQGTVMWMQEHV